MVSSNTCLAILAFARLALVDAGSIHRRDAVPAPYVAAPYYPTPHGGWAPEWADSYAKAKLLVEQMTLAEKVNITSGSGIFMGPCVGNTGSAERLGFRQLCLQDSALGVRQTDHITVFPAGITTGATWDKELFRARAEALGKEFKGKGANIWLGPAVGPIGRKPRGGRNWEGFGADPVLQGKAGAITIKAVQEQGVIATIKHLIGNEQEMYRMTHIFQEGYSANIDDRTLHEIYLWPFAEGVHAGVGAVMTAYNNVNGSASTQNSMLINGILKDELGFNGFVMSDWLSQNSGIASALAGLDMSMPGDIHTVPLALGQSFWNYDLSRSALNGSVPMDRLNDMVTRVVAAWYQMGQDKDYTDVNFSSNTDKETGLLYPGALFSPSGVVNKFVDVSADHWKVAREIAQDGVTLLKNDGNVLPLKRSTPLRVFGTGAAVNPDGPNGCTDRNCNKGTLGMGWGSGTATYQVFHDPITSIKNNSADVTYYQTDNFPNVPTPGDDDVAMVFISSDSGENTYTVEGNHGDRDNSGLKAWYGGDDLIKKAAAKYKSVIVVAHTVGPLVMEDWVNLPSVKAVLIAHLPGQEAGHSLANVLYGDVSPSGHLPYSIPVSEDDYPASTKLRGFVFGQVQDTYSEGPYFDYRFLQKNNIKPRFAFGHGLSYANFTFSDATIRRVTQLSSTPPPRQPKGPTPVYSNALPQASEVYWPEKFNQIWRYLYPYLSKNDADNAAKDSSKKYNYPTGYSSEQKPGPAAGGGQGGNPALWDVAYEITVKVSNDAAASHAGKAVAQLYMQYPEGIPYDTPIVQLRDFEKTAPIAPGQSTEIKLTLTRRDVSVWDVVSQNWVVPQVDGRYKFWIGSASDNLSLACYADTLTCEGGLAPPA
ncbi:hypothetical protein PspLS_04668 [Pyricularia sp. CBS 133598]|nr:hypothetical protein PspLS_04668 [Pyricularia sp. CBS 133598]